MSQSIGPVIDGEVTGVASVAESVGKIGMAVVVGLLEIVARVSGLDTQMTYEYKNNRLKLSGESESPGNEVNRGFLLGYILLLVISFSMAGMDIASQVASAIGSTGAQTVGVIVTCLFATIAFGGILAAPRCEIIDHTTEKFEVDESIEEAYMNEEIDEEELEKRLEADMS